MKHQETKTRVLLDESVLPVLLVTYPEDGDEEDLTALFAAYRRIAAAHPRVAYLVDMRRLNPREQTAAKRRHAGRLYAEHADALAVSAVCEARLVSNSLVRGIVVAFDWIKGDQRWPCRTFTDPEAARAWIDEQLAAAAA
ncbi:MAG: hypothetical protein AAF447_00205 [Myxococcota bacterium]